MEKDSTLHNRLIQSQLDRIEADLLDLKYQFQDLRTEFRGFRAESSYFKAKFQELSSDHEILRNRFEQLKLQSLSFRPYGKDGLSSDGQG